MIIIAGLRRRRGFEFMISAAVLFKSHLRQIFLFDLARRLTNWRQVPSASRLNDTGVECNVPPSAGPTMLKGELLLPSRNRQNRMSDTWIDLWASSSPERTSSGAISSSGNHSASNSSRPLCRRWRKGLVFVNGFNLGRYWDAGPQRTLYVPGPLLQRGFNEVSL